jgi:hypothetical protein
MLKEMYQGTGGFGGLLITATEWTSLENWYHCLELFTRYVMPEFQGTTRGTKGAWRRMVEDSAAGRLPSPYGPVPRSQ